MLILAFYCIQRKLINYNTTSISMFTVRRMLTRNSSWNCVILVQGSSCNASVPQNIPDPWCHCTNIHRFFFSLGKIRRLTWAWHLHSEVAVAQCSLAALHHDARLQWGASALYRLFPHTHNAPLLSQGCPIPDGDRGEALLAKAAAVAAAWLPLAHTFKVIHRHFIYTGHTHMHTRVSESFFLPLLSAVLLCRESAMSNTTSEVTKVCYAKQQWNTRRKVERRTQSLGFITQSFAHRFHCGWVNTLQL